MLDTLSIDQDWVLVLGLALYGMVSISHSITSDAAAWWQVVLLLMCALARCITLVVETLAGAWLYRGV